MAKSNTILIRLVSSADTGYFYVTKKNPDDDLQDGEEEVRSGGAQARRLPRSQDQVGRGG